MTVEELARDAIAAVNSRANILLAARWASLRYQEVAAKYRLRHLRRVGETVVPGAVSAGTATTTRGSATVVGDATARAAWFAIKAEIDAGQRAFRGATVWYSVQGLTPANDLMLVTPYAEDGGTSAGYMLVVRYALLAPSVRFITAAGLPRLSRPLSDGSITRWADQDPNRARVSVPELWAETTPDPNGRRRIEVYPYCAVTELVTYLYYLDPPTLALRDPLPPGIDGALLKDGILVDINRWEAAEAVRNGQVEQGAYWRNEARAQETRWGDTMGRIVGADQGADDAEVLLLLHPEDVSGRSIKTAYDMVWNR
jgi:hypothetical protein